MTALVLNGLSAVCALAAAILWFWAGVHPLPLMRTYWDQAPASDPFFRALQKVARLNAYAALCAGAAALLFVGATAVEIAAALTR